MSQVLFTLACQVLLVVLISLHKNMVNANIAAAAYKEKNVL